MSARCGWTESDGSACAEWMPCPIHPCPGCDGAGVIEQDGYTTECPNLAWHPDEDADRPVVDVEHP